MRLPSGIPFADQFGNSLILLSSDENIKFCYRLHEITIEPDQSFYENDKNGLSIHTATKMVNLLLSNLNKSYINIDPSQVQQLLSKQNCFCRRTLLDQSNDPQSDNFNKIDTICRKLASCKKCSEKRNSYGAVSGNYKKVIVAPETGEFNCMFENQSSSEQCLCDLSFGVNIAKLLLIEILTKPNYENSDFLEVVSNSFLSENTENTCLTIQTFISALTDEGSIYQNRLGLLDKPDKCCGESPDWKLYSSKSSVCINGELN